MLLAQPLALVLKVQVAEQAPSPDSQLAQVKLQLQFLKANTIVQTSAKGALDVWHIC